MKTKFLTTLCFLSWFVLLCSADSNKQLRFNEHGKFKIVQFTDLHYGYNEYENSKTAVVQDVILAEEKPDLVIITGDLVSGYEWEPKDKDWFRSRWQQLIAPMIKHNIMWAIALGNHDIEGDLSGSEIVQLENTQELSLTQHGPLDISGATNYYLPIYTYNTSESHDIGQLLWVFDSGSNGCLGVSGWGCIKYDQVAWYRNASRALAAARAPTHETAAAPTQETATAPAREPAPPIPALAFFHIPLYEHLDLWNVQGVQGDLGEGEGVCCSSLNTGLYAAMREMGDIKGVYCGHDHSNDYIGDYHGIALGFGRKTGYGCYGPPLGWQHGARVLEITQNEFGARSWLRLEDGSVEIQKHNGLSWRKFLGCCSMEGHGRVAMTWLNLLTLALSLLTISTLVALLVRAGVRLYIKERKSGRGLEYLRSLLWADGDEYVGDEREDAEGQEDVVVGMVQKYLWRPTTPRPRQRRINELEAV